MKFLASSSLAIAAAAALASPQYPQTRTVDHTDDYHGTKIADPYRWLEQPISNPEVKAWVDEENKVTFGWLGQIEGRDRLLKEITRRGTFERFSTPVKIGNLYIYDRNTGSQNQDVLYMQRGLRGKPEILLDPNKLSKDGTVALSGSELSDDGRRFLYAVSKSGSDWTDIHVMDVATRKPVGKPVLFNKFAIATFNKDATGIYYVRFPEPKKDQKFVGSTMTGSIYYHRIGDPQSKDRLLYQQDPKTENFLSFGLDEQREHMWIYVEEPGKVYGKIFQLDLTKKGAKVEPLFEDDASYSIIHRAGNTAYVLTTKNAKRGQIIKVDLKNPKGRKAFIPSGRDKIAGASFLDGKFVITYLRDATGAAAVYDLSGKKLRDIPMPGPGTIDGFGGKSENRETFYTFLGMGTPPSIYRYDLRTGKSTLFKSPKMPMDTSKYESKQVFYPAKDGTKIPMFITYKKGLKLDGTNPTILYGYGGFNSPMLPWFSSGRTVWMDMGGVYAVACIRGGGEYGEEWHQAAIKTKRQVAWDDFIAGGEYLIAEKYASSQTLAINGGSNGGLLVGACMVQRPDLFAVAIPEVGVLDMLRFNQFTVGKGWEGDYGSPQNPDEFAFLAKTSPYHNLKDGTKYPATLILTADTDDRVVPAHSFKFAARLQAAQAKDGPPVLLRVQTGAGHGGGKPIYKAREEQRDIFAFILANMGRKIPAKF